MPVIKCYPLHQDQYVRFPDWGDGTVVAWYPEAVVQTGYGFNFYTQIPTGSTINSATFQLQNSAKFADQTASVTSRLFYQLSSNAAPFVAGVTTWNSWSNVGRGNWFGGASFGSTYNANGGAQYTQLTVTSEVQNLINTYGLVPGGYISFGLVIDAESGDFRYGSPELTIDYTPPASPVTYWDFNMLENPDFVSSAVGWDPNQNFFNNLQAGGTVTRDTSFTRNAIPTGKFTCPTPDGSGKSTGFNAYVSANEPDKNWVFSGEIYIPAALPPVYARFFYAGWKLLDGPRDTWQPFCTDPHYQSTYGTVWPTITVDPGFTAGQSLWVTNLALYKSDFRQMPWSGRTSNRSTVVHHMREAGNNRGPHVRSSSPVGRVVGSANGGTTAARRAYKMDSSGLWTEAGQSKI